MAGWACSRPSKIQRMPKPIRSMAPGRLGRAHRGATRGRRAAGSHSFTPTQATASTANTSSAMMP